RPCLSKHDTIPAIYTLPLHDALPICAELGSESTTCVSRLLLPERRREPGGRCSKPGRLALCGWREPAQPLWQPYCRCCWHSAPGAQPAYRQEWSPCWT